MDNQSVITEFLTLQEIILHARRTLPAEVWDFIMGGGESEATLKRNRHALDCLGFRSQTLRTYRASMPPAASWDTLVRCPSCLPPWVQFR